MSSLTLLASAAGGVIFGVLADRKGRTWALRASVLIYSVFTAACGLASTVPMLAVFRIFLGLGMGGEWSSGAALVTETWPAEHRGKAMGFVQSFWAVGYAAAALVTAVVFRWRLAGRLLRRRPPGPSHLLDPEEGRGAGDLEGAQKAAAAGRAKIRVRDVLRGRLLGITVAVTLMNAFTLFAWWGFNTWIPGYLSLAREPGRDRAQLLDDVRLSSSSCSSGCGWDI